MPDVGPTVVGITRANAATAAKAAESTKASTRSLRVDAEGRCAEPVAAGACGEFT